MTFKIIILLMQFSLNHTDKINLSYKVIYISGTDRLHISPSLHWLYAPLRYSKTGFSQSKRVWTHCKLLILKYFFYCFPLMFLCWGSRVLMCRILNVSILEGIKIRRGKNISLKFVLEQMRLMSVLCLAGFAFFTWKPPDWVCSPHTKSVNSWGTLR